MKINLNISVAAIAIIYNEKGVLANLGDIMTKIIKIQHGIPIPGRIKHVYNSTNWLRPNMHAATGENEVAFCTSVFVSSSIVVLRYILE